jgi:hypothetical protein
MDKTCQDGFIKKYPMSKLEASQAIQPKHDLSQKDTLCDHTSSSLTNGEVSEGKHVGNIYINVMDEENNHKQALAETRA